MPLPPPPFSSSSTWSATSTASTTSSATPHLSIVIFSSFSAPPPVVPLIFSPTLPPLARSPLSQPQSPSLMGGGRGRRRLHPSLSTAGDLLRENFNLRFQLQCPCRRWTFGSGRPSSPEHEDKAIAATFECDSEDAAIRVELPPPTVWPMADSTPTSSIISTVESTFIEPAP
ncbi:hypothetical protein BDZ97DRAFT_1872647 [Flammula alnicola]|nr:hypothetical protein BDZ97DRAFT_1872647 [Flammula alnicola]